MSRNDRSPVQLSGPWISATEIAGDASSRSYRRLRSATGETVVEVAYPKTEHTAFRRDLEVSTWCLQHGLPVPVVYGIDVVARRALLQDFGAMDAEQELRQLSDRAREQAFARLITPLGQLAGIASHELPGWNPPLARVRLRWELAGFELWAVSTFLGRRPPAELSDWLDHLAEEVAAHPTRVCHRDYHLNNLFFLTDGGVGMIDFQDILVGPDSYDAASLLGDRAAPELLSPAAQDRWLERWARETAAPGDWRHRWRQVTMQRGLKVLGTFCRLQAAGRSGYAQWLTPLVRRLVAIVAESPEAECLRDVLVHWSASGGPHVR